MNNTMNDDYLNFKNLTILFNKLKNLFAVKEDISAIKTPIFDDNVAECTTIDSAILSSIDAADGIQSEASIYTILSKIKKAIYPITDALMIFKRKVGIIDGITSDINSESTTIAASSKMVHDINSNLINVSTPAVAGVTANTAYVKLATANAARKYVGTSLVVLGGSFQVSAVIPASTVITLATAGEAIANPVCQHNISISNDHFIATVCWMDINGVIHLFSQAAIPVGTYIHFNDCYVYR